MSSAVIIRAGARVGAIIGMIDAIGAVLAAGAMTVIGRVAVARPAAAARLAIITCQIATQASDNNSSESVADAELDHGGQLILHKAKVKTQRTHGASCCSY